MVWRPFKEWLQRKMESGSQPPPITPPPPPRASPQSPYPPLYTSYVPTARVRLGIMVWRLFMISNLGIAAYALVMPINKKDPGVGEEKAPKPEIVMPINKKDPGAGKEKASEPEIVMPINKKDPSVEEEKAPEPEIVMPINKKDPSVEEGKAPQPENPPPVDFGNDPHVVPSSASTEPLLPPREPISEDQVKKLCQWMLEVKKKIKPDQEVELCQWMLEEKRKIKP